MGVLPAVTPIAFHKSGGRLIAAGVPQLEIIPSARSAEMNAEPRPAAATATTLDNPGGTFVTTDPPHATTVPSDLSATSKALCAATAMAFVRGGALVQAPVPQVNKVVAGDCIDWAM
jgi:hypothetical protein